MKYRSPIAGIVSTAVLAFSVFAAAPADTMNHDAEVPEDEKRDQHIAVLYPHHRSVVTNRVISVLAVNKKPDAKLTAYMDGDPVPFKTIRFSAALADKPVMSFLTSPGAEARWAPHLDDKHNTTLVLAELSITPGKHEISIGPATIVITRSDPGSVKEDSRIFTPHPPVVPEEKTASCGMCHEFKQANDCYTLGAADTNESCKTCHSPVDLRMLHGHVMEPLNDCLMCHDPHGAVHPKLLINTREKLCSQCHESGHFAM
ncbi:MAG: hypothetical protein K9N48_01810 [Verrucomicrobia bacterium]|nr:hypothetical protein [Verrucomicrobiota bacterium]MCF7709083.1 hypothetical protein [Verrucomicrobiota bacterium]